MSGKLKIYKEKLDGYKKFYSIVKTIKTVTMAKFRLAMARVKTRDYGLRYTEKAFKAPQEEAEALKEATKTLLYVPITTNRGSCGPINSNTYKYLETVVSPKTKFLVVGKKGNDSISRLFPAQFQYTVINDFKQALHFGYASYIYENTQTIADVERTQFVFHRFVSAGVQRLATYTLPSYEKWLSNLQTKSSTDTDKVNYQFANAVLNLDDVVVRDFYDFHATLMILNATCENEHSEYASRLVAVEAQMQNIKGLWDKTQYLFNKTRQSSITAALIEILSAMSAMGGGQGGELKPKFFS